jgi:hypothetical protein
MVQIGWGRRGRPLGDALVVAIALAVALLGACSSAPSSSTSARPTTPARLRILAPAPGAVVGTRPTLRLELSSARLATAARAADLPTDEGFVHVYVDNKLVSVLYGLTQKLPTLDAGTHSVRVEFVAADHAPFANQVVAATQFKVKP